MSQTGIHQKTQWRGEPTMSISVLGIDIGKNNFHPPVTAPVNISHHLLSPRVLAADAQSGAAIAVTVTGQ